jgi:ferric-dicitrate binding protein FerR (iron transport regulator)
MTTTLTMKQAAQLTDIDRRVVSQIEALYGPATKAAPVRAEHSRPTAPRRSLAGAMIRTVVLVAMSVALVMWTAPGRTMYEAVSDGARSAYDALLSGSLLR